MNQPQEKKPETFTDKLLTLLVGLAGWVIMLGIAAAVLWTCNRALEAGGKPTNEECFEAGGNLPGCYDD